MLLIASEKSKRSRAVSNVVRELSLSLAIFASPATFAELLAGPLRRIVLLTETEVTDAIVAALQTAEHVAELGIIVAADREDLEASPRSGALGKLEEIDNVEWIPPVFDYNSLSTAARRCRRQMLRVSRDELEEALHERRFFVQYQPKVERISADEWRTREAEALIRLRHPEHGQLGPLEFLPEIEEFGLMARLTDYVLEEAAAQLVRWKLRNLDLSICINLASSQLDDERLVARCAEIVGRFRLPCPSFTFEVVEQALADPGAPHLRTLRTLREKGFRLCFDGFRVTAASLSSLEKLPFDEVKIHASAISRAQDDPVRLKVLAAIIGLAHNLGMTVCAEGVEEPDTFEFLRTIECDKMQGFLISEAVMPKLLRKVYGPDSEKDQVA
jgi:EAL domain-containing protein (putative c-di-GMP-specific phosphodiesterase class I)